MTREFPNDANIDNILKMTNDVVAQIRTQIIGSDL